MKLEAVFAILVVLVACASFEETSTKQCPSHEYYSNSTCKLKVLCEGTCNNIFPSCSPNYPGKCILGLCLCNSGYVREVKNGPCIPIRQCKGGSPFFCGPNEEHVSSSPCQPTCVIPVPPKHQTCEGRIQELCVCKKGFIRVVPGGGACVPENRCPNTCLENETWNDCGPACPPSCEDLNPKCLRVCVRGCYCNKGFIFSNRIGRCVPESWCPRI